MSEKKSFYIDQVFELLDSLKNKSINAEKRIQLSIELAEMILLIATSLESSHEKKEMIFLTKFIFSIKGKAFLCSLLDQCFRSSNDKAANQLSYLMFLYGIPEFFPINLKIKFFLLRLFANSLPYLFMPIISKAIIKGCYYSVLIADEHLLYKHIYQRKEQNIDLTIALLLEIPLSKQTINKNLRTYQNYLSKPEIQTLSINLSYLVINSNFLSIEKTIKQAAELLKTLYKQAIKHNAKKPKTIFIDIQEHKDFELSIKAFESAIMDPEIINYSAGITLLAYFPESFEYQKRLTDLAKKRIKVGGAPIIIRITKGLSLNYEQIEAAKKSWPAPVFHNKFETDANFKKMMKYGSIPDNVKASHLHISSLNVFDIAYALILRNENEIEPYVHFELIEGRAFYFKNAIRKIIGDNFSLYLPIVEKNNFSNAIGYLIKRLDESTINDNFITHIANIQANSKEFIEQSSIFKKSVNKIDTISNTPRYLEKTWPSSNTIEIKTSFVNAPNTNFLIEENQKLAKDIIESNKTFKPAPIPISIGENLLQDKLEGQKINPSYPDKSFYQYELASKMHLQKIIEIAKQEENSWKNIAIDKKQKLLSNISQKLKENKKELITALMIDISKTIIEADLEISDAIDAIEYHKNQIKRILSRADVEYSPKGTCLIVPAWNFPIHVAIEEIICALLAGNTVIFKPSFYAVYVSWKLVNLMWEAGIPKKCLQFINTTNELFENVLIKNPKINSVIMHTSAKIAKKLIQFRNGLHLTAQCGGINTIIVTALADKNQAIKDIIESSFYFSGQKFSSSSILILEKEVYEDKEFLNKLVEATKELKVGSVWNSDVTITPLIKEPQDELLTVLTTLEQHEEWLLKPQKDPNNHNLYSPGIKLNVLPSSLTKNQEFYAPILSIMQANDLSHAVKLANDSKFALSAGLYSLDQREHHFWLKNIQAGNCFINSKITNAKIRRQPFGGYKQSAFGNEYKIGGPNFLLEFMNLKQKLIPKEKKPVNDWVNSLTSFLEKIDLSAEQLGIWYASISNYSYWWKRMKQDNDPNKLLGQDNILKYIPRQKITLRIYEDSSALDALRVCAAALTCSMPLEISWTGNRAIEELNWIELLPMLSLIEETEDEFIKRIKEHKIKRLRLINPASESIKKVTAETACCIIDQNVLANGRYELLHYVREVSITKNYDRYGILGIREGELRKPII